MIFRIRNALIGFIITMLGIVIALWLYSENEWSLWPILGGIGALIALIMLAIARRLARPRP